MSEPVSFASPFSFTTKGAVKVNVQESPADQVSRAYNVCVCVEGEREDNPEFGIPDLTFTQVPLDIEAVQNAIARWAGLTVTATEAETVLNAAQRAISVEVG